ncbi:hypothetical protein [Jeotgalibacillus proteolyticus]|uniref:Uncharacterized protein n=1 Tax=Jeotgalibacillus proteolyticus TaxID=2082395 RepID=A0A2S5GGJ1_9BACL|nr:hypothetical protein [Jeotgalibacillus proteolyticus]PPA71983.1 hypothetical protein C4B60_00975 [Jeotgalibacillus proteolyticus]
MKLQEKKLILLTRLLLIIGGVSTLFYYLNSFHITVLSTVFLVTSIVSFFALIIVGILLIYRSSHTPAEKRYL